MIVVISQYSGLHRDDDGNVVPIPQDRIAGEARTTAGTFAALNTDARFIKVVTDTNIRFEKNGAVTANSDLILSEAWFECNGGEQPQITVA